MRATLPQGSLTEDGVSGTLLLINILVKPVNVSQVPSASTLLLLNISMTSLPMFRPVIQDFLIKSHHILGTEHSSNKRVKYCTCFADGQSKAQRLAVTCPEK